MVGFKARSCCGLLAFVILAFGAITISCPGVAEPKETPLPYFRITVVDDESGRGIPLVRLSTTNQATYWTDSAGVIAFHEPELMDKDIWFSPETYGYSPPGDGSWRGGVRLHPTPGGSAVIELRRENIAQRLYRITGAGIYRDSVMLGDEVPPTQDPSPSPVVGQDSVATAVYKGKIFWIWGDTSVPGSPLGNFRVTAATSELPSKGGLDPEAGVYLKYFRAPDGRVKSMANMESRGPIWFGRLRVGLDESGSERLFAPYAKIAPGGSMRAEERGWCVFDDEAEVFNFVCTLEEFDRAGKGERDWHEHRGLRWRWKETLDPAVEKQIQHLVKAGHLNPETPWGHLTDINAGDFIHQHGGTVCWNEYRQRWTNIRLQNYGKSFLGEVWYFEGDTPEGPWVYGQKIATHFLNEKDTYTFYGVFQHPEFDKDGGRVIFFEGTYTTFIAAAPYPTPHYNYNQIMYKLELDDPRLFLPVPVYRVGGEIPAYHTKTDMDEDNTERAIVWFAPDRPREGTIPIYEHLDRKTRTAILTAEKPSGVQPSVAFYALPATEKEIPEGTLKITAPLNEFLHPASGKRVYTTQDSVAQPGYRKSGAAVCRVWKSPT